MTLSHRVAVGLVLVTCAASTGASPGQPDRAAWQPFDASWSASGERHTLVVEGGRVASVTRLSGALVLRNPAGLSRGFRAEALAYDDGRGDATGRAVWTDSAGDRVFSAVTGQMAEGGRRVRGTITGGTGRYAGLTGEYTFTWQYALPGEEGRMHAVTVAITGRYRRESTP